MSQASILLPFTIFGLIMAVLLLIAFTIGLACIVIEWAFKKVKGWAFFLDMFVIYVQQSRSAAKQYVREQTSKRMEGSALAPASSPAKGT